MIHFDNVSKIYPDNSIALDDVTFNIDQNEFVSVVGHSGAGKTTLVKMILAEERPSGGQVFFESVDVHNLPDNKIPELRQRIGTIFQDFRLLPSRTAYENVAFAMEVAGKSDEEIEQDVPEVLELVGLENKMWNFPKQLSGGERQRAAIARAIINQPDLLIADEPTGNLDPINTREIIEILKRINDLGTTVLLTTHDKNVLDYLNRRVITMDTGKIIRDDEKGKYIL